MNNICEACIHFSQENKLCTINESVFLANCNQHCDLFVNTETSAVEVLSDDINNKVSLDEICKVIDALKTYSADQIIVREDTPESLALALNSRRAQLIIFLKDIFVKDIFNTTEPSFFYEYLQTLQPFMFTNSVISEDEDSIYNIYQRRLYIFEYPCGTQSIQIKVCVKENQIILVSFHKGATGLAALSNRYLATAESWGHPGYLYTTMQTIRICIDHMYCDITMESYDKQERLYTSSSEVFFEDYRIALTTIINSVIDNSAYEVNVDLKLTNKHKISVYSAITIAEYGCNCDSLSERGKLHALVSLGTLVDNQTLTADIMRHLVESDNIINTLVWLKEHDASQGLTVLQTLLLEGGDDSDAIC